MSNFLPITRQEALDRGWEELDFVCVTGDAYVDHPSFGMAIDVYKRQPGEWPVPDPASR